jgi:hypothetical protein
MSLWHATNAKRENRGNSWELKGTQAVPTHRGPLALSSLEFPQFLFS